MIWGRVILGRIEKRWMVNRMLKENTGSSE